MKTTGEIGLISFNAVGYIMMLLALVAIQCDNRTVDRDAETDPRPGKPNIVFILADDMGWNEVSFNGADSFITPHINKLKTESVSLSQFYVHAVCAPTRAAFLTGKYPFRTWSDWRSEDFGKPSYLEKLDLQLATNEEGDLTRRIHGLPTSEITIAEALRDLGYFTAITGKWHCGEWLPEHLPMGQGFMHQYGHYAWGIDYTNYTIPHNAPARFAVYDWHRNQQPLNEQGYTTDLIANEVVRLLSDHKVNHGDQPFFYYVAFNAIHGPLEDIPRYTDRLSKREAALKCLDDAVGRIVGALEQYGFADNTFLVFTNDNGGLRQNMNAPYRGTKNTNYEGGVRVPCLIRWPGNIMPSTSNNQIMHITDFYRTFVSLAGDTADRDLDSYDMLNMIIKDEPSLRTEIIFEVEGSVRPPAIRWGDYKLIGSELFDIAKDPYEQTDLAGDLPGTVDSLKTRLAEAAAERPSMPDVSRLMVPALPWVYGQSENLQAPHWIKDHVARIRARQPQTWAEGETPWPQAPKDGKILYTGDGR